MDYSPSGPKESDTAEQLTYVHTSVCVCVCVCVSVYVCVRGHCNIEIKEKKGLL